MSDLTTVQLSKESSRKLGEIARIERRSKTKQAEHLIEVAYVEIVEVTELPGPGDHTPVPLVKVKS